jgi:ketol-acid reductoisomerase
LTFSGLTLLVRWLAIGIGIGSGYLFPTTFKHEVFSDLTGKRAGLMGALDWKPRFKKAVLPAFKELYQHVKNGKEVAAIGNSDMWQAGKAVRALRPKEPGRAIAVGTKGIAGRAAN